MKDRVVSESLISIIIPAYNEESNIAILLGKLVLALESYKYEIIFIDDGSTDNTLGIIAKIHHEMPNVHFISFSRNFGHQNALKAGIDYSNGDLIISMDADLQHPPYIIKEMIMKWEEGFDIVYTKRIEQPDLPLFKKLTSTFFYKTLNLLSDTSIDSGTSDFRLIDKEIANLIRHTTESNLFLRGFISWLGFKQYKIVFSPEKRHSGKTKYSFVKMLGFGLNGITSFSIKPLRLSIYLGLLVSSIAFVYAFYAIYIYFFTQKVVSGWTSVLASVLFLGGVQLFILGIIGEYLGKMFMNVKKRPDYIITNTSLNKSHDKDS